MKVLYWEQKGPANTEAVSKLAIQRARELKINHIVVASNSGATAEQFFDQGLEIICVTHHVGFMSPGDDEMPSETRQKLSEKGVQILTTTHLMAGLDRALRIKFGGVYPAEIIAQTLRMLGQGVKVCVEISGMALDAGLIPYGREIIAVGGSGTGADTALVITPAHSNNFFDTKIKEIICKPREF
ncbi:MAG: pyruvate kinase alpha/beta domain-containing protein [Syntrophaceticus schinkii]|nr:pyruvate kinase alpha/beta domain-containing protein [Syntrophaceticus schinkii]